MVQIESHTELFSDNEKLLLKNACDNFVPTDESLKNIDNYYVRSIINKNDRGFEKIISKVTKHINNISTEFKCELMGMFINQVTSETNTDDGFHTDSDDFTYILYLNDEYEGGEFEYRIGKKEVKISTEKYMSISISNDVLHRVNPVKTGKRYSFVMFYENKNRKKNKTLV
jgi:predicted 2-oxoglutarate/Fe(II)-dependent dioxygenase YbiX